MVSPPPITERFIPYSYSDAFRTSPTRSPEMRTDDNGRSPTLPLPSPIPDPSHPPVPRDPHTAYSPRSVPRPPPPPIPRPLGPRNQSSTDRKITEALSNDGDVKRWRSEGKNRRTRRRSILNLILGVEKGNGGFRPGLDSWLFQESIIHDGRRRFHSCERCPHYFPR